MFFLFRGGGLEKNIKTTFYIGGGLGKIIKFTFYVGGGPFLAVEKLKPPSVFNLLYCYPVIISY